MGKAILFLLVMMALGIAFMVYSGGKKAAEKGGPIGTAVKENTPDVKVDIAAPDLSGAKKEFDSIAGKAIDQAKNIADKAKTYGDPDVKAKGPVEVNKNGSVKFMLVRTSADLPEYSVVLEPAPGSGLTASGGTFADGQTEAEVTLNANADATSAALIVRAGGKKTMIPVSVK